jgi:hypothetical protein
LLKNNQGFFDSPEKAPRCGAFSFLTQGSGQRTIKPWPVGSGKFDTFALPMRRFYRATIQKMLPLKPNHISIVVVSAILAGALTCGTMCKAQTADEPYHAANAKAGWGGTKGVCNVCHEPFQAHYANRQPAPYQNHQVTASTFTGSKLDGAPVQIRTDKVSEKCQSCHAPMGGQNLATLKDERDFFEVHRK